jgi:hypothetical protein
LIPYISVCGQDDGIPSLYSSLERSNREFACPQESVAVTCSVSGTSLAWEAQLEGDNKPVQIAHFGQNDQVGFGFSRPERISWIIFSGVLVAIEDRNPMVNIQLRNSSMIVTPVSSNALSHYAPITIICKALDSGADNRKTMIYQIAGESLLLYTLRPINSYPHHSLSGSSGNYSLLLNHYTAL